MNAAVVVTYRCNAHCQMCNTWRHPSKKDEELSLETISKLPNNIGQCNITGGEPMLRDDIEDIVAILLTKAKLVEISTNGSMTDKIVRLAKKYPDVRIRVSIEGLGKTNDEIRGIPNGFDKALRTMLCLKEAGVKDIGFATVIQDANAKELLDVFRLTRAMDIEFAQAVPHNSFYFHKYDNNIYDKELVTSQIRDLMRCFLKTKRPKLWFRAYLNRGLIDYINGSSRALTCTAGTDVFFLDPFGEIYPCNGMKESMGSLNRQDFDDIWNGSDAQKIRDLVANCPKNCWMTGTAVPAMKRHLASCAYWVGTNKLKLHLGKEFALE